MKRTILIFLLTFPCAVFAQNDVELMVLEISNGPALLQTGREKTELEVGQNINNKDIIHLNDGTMMILLDLLNCDRYTLKGSFKGSISDYQKRNEGTCVKHITKTFANYLIAQSRRAKKSSDGKYEDDHATVFRDGDSIMMSPKSIDSLYHIIDSLSVKASDSTKVSPNSPVIPAQ